jgi:hypothetical protein
MTKMHGLWVVIGVGAAIGVWLVVWGPGSVARRTLEPAPFIDYPEWIELGEHEVGATAVARFHIANTGTADLVVENISANCSCTGLEREESGEFVKVTKIVLAPGERMPLVIRQTVRGFLPGGPAHTFVQFDTNDPIRSAGAIRISVARVKCGVHSFPNTVVVGSVPVGTEVSKELDILDDAETPRTVRSVVSSDPKRVKVRLLDFPVQNVVRGPTGTQIGRMAVSIDTASPGAIDASISIQLNGENRPPDTVSVVGSVLLPIEIIPKSVMLPRSGTHGPVYELTAVCSSSKARPFTLSFLRLPAGVQVNQTEMSGARASRVFTVSVDPMVCASTSTIKGRVRFLEGEELDVEIPVVVGAAEGQK